MVIIQTNLIIIVINKRYLINKIDETNYGAQNETYIED